MPDGGKRLTTVFLDRDGVINRKAPEGDYVKNWSEFAFLPGVLDALRLLSDAGMRIVIVSNQRGIARGVMSEADLTDIHDRMSAEIARSGGRIAAIYHCPHDGGCECRKPAPGMLREAARDLPAVRLDQSVMIGDRAHDMEAAAAVGASQVLISGFDERVPRVDYVAGDLLDAARWVLGAASARDPERAPREPA